MIVYELVSLELQRHQDETIQETYAVIASAYGDSDLTDLLDTVRTNIHATRGHARIFLVTGPDGKALAGNIPAQDFPDGWSDAVAGRIGLSGDMRYRIYAGEVDGKRLVVGLSYQEVDSLNEIMLGSFAWASLVVVVLAVAGGVLIATRAQSRFDAVRDTMDRVSLGDLSARIPLSDRNDDIDLLARDINAALTRLAATVEGMKQVSADIAHDLKTPLNRLKITIEDALNRHEDGEAVVGDLELAAAEADQINQTFEALLRIAQIESGARKASFAAVDLEEILTALADVYADVAEDAGQKLVECHPEGRARRRPGRQGTAHADVRQPDRKRDPALPAGHDDQARRRAASGPDPHHRRRRRHTAFRRPSGSASSVASTGWKRAVLRRERVSVSASSRPSLTFMRRRSIWRTRGRACVSQSPSPWRVRHCSAAFNIRTRRRSASAEAQVQSHEQGSKIVPCDSCMLVTLVAFYQLGSMAYRAYTARARRERIAGIDAIENCDALVKAREQDSAGVRLARLADGLRRCDAEAIAPPGDTVHPQGGPLHSTVGSLIVRTCRTALCAVSGVMSQFLTEL